MDVPLESIFTDYPTIATIEVLFQAHQSSSDDSSSDDHHRLLRLRATSRLRNMKRGRSRQLCLCHVPLQSYCKAHLLRPPRHSSSSQMCARSATSYTGIPRVDSRVGIVALNSPYHGQPHLFNCIVDDLIKSCLDEIRRRQPKRPLPLWRFVRGRYSGLPCHSDDAGGLSRESRQPHHHRQPRTARAGPSPSTSTTTATRFIFWPELERKRLGRGTEMAPSPF